MFAKWTATLWKIINFKIFWQIFFWQIFNKIFAKWTATLFENWNWAILNPFQTWCRLLMIKLKIFSNYLKCVLAQCSILTPHQEIDPSQPNPPHPNSIIATRRYIHLWRFKFYRFCTFACLLLILAWGAKFWN